MNKSTIAGFVVVGGLVAAGLLIDFRPSLPRCDDPPVHELASKALSERIKLPFDLGSFATVESESTNEKRVCRVRIALKGVEPAEWLKFTIEPHGKGEIFLQFTQ